MYTGEDAIFRIKGKLGAPHNFWRPQITDSAPVLPLTQPFTYRIVDKQLSLCFLGHKILSTHIDRICGIAELYAQGLGFNHASTYREARDEWQKHP